MRALSNARGRRAAQILLAWIAVLCLRGSAAAQTDARPEESQPVRVGPVVLGGYIQYDYRAAGEAGEAAEPDQFYPRRVRVQLSGLLARGIKWAVSAEATATPVLRDAYIVLDHFPAATLRIGQVMMPFSFERAIATSNAMEFTERVLSAMAPGRDAGVMVSNERPFFGWLTYGAAIHNGTGQNTRDDNRAKDALLRLAATPVRAAGLSLAINAARGDQPEGMRTRLGADIVYERRAYHLGTEFLRERTRNGQETQDGFYAFGSWRLYPKTARRGLHHLEFATRYAWLQGPVATRQVDLAANYYVHPRLRFMFDVILPAGRGAAERQAGIHARANLRF